MTEPASRPEFEEHLAGREYEVVVADLNILGFEGLQLLDAVQAGDPLVQVVIFTGTDSKELAVDAKERGVDVLS